MGEKAELVRELFGRLVRALAAERLDYALCGGWAVALWGFPRLTTDIDLVVAAEDLERACAILDPVGFSFVAGRIPLPSQGIEFYRVSAISGEELIPLDMYPVPRDHPFLCNRVWVQWQEVAVPVLDIRDLIQMKSKSERAKDRMDIDELQRIQAALASGKSPGSGISNQADRDADGS